MGDVAPFHIFIRSSRADRASQPPVDRGVRKDAQPFRSSTVDVEIDRVGGHDPQPQRHLQDQGQRGQSGPARGHRPARAGAATECGGVGSAMRGHSLRCARLARLERKEIARIVRVRDRVAAGSYAKARQRSIATETTEFTVGRS